MKATVLWAGIFSSFCMSIYLSCMDVQVREMDGIALILDHTTVDANNPCILKRGVLCCIVIVSTDGHVLHTLRCVLSMG